MQRLRRPFKKLAWEHLAVYVAYFVVMLVVTYPLINVISQDFAGDFLTDAYQISRHAWWIKYALLNGEPIFDQPYLGYPNGLPGTLVWANPLQFFPVWLFAFFMPLPLAYNLMLLLRMSMNGWAVYWLARYLTRQRYPAMLAGLIFMIYPAAQGRIYGGHPDILLLWAGPLYLYALLRMRDSAQKKWIAMAAGMLFLGVAGNTSMLIYYMMPLATMGLLWCLAAQEWRWFLRGLTATFIGALLSLLLLLPLFLETFSASAQFTTDIGGSVRYSPDLLGIVSPSFYHPAYDEYEYNRHVLGINLVEGIAYIGILPPILALLAFWKKPQARRWLILAVVAWVLSLGPALKIEDKLVVTQVDDFEGNVYQTYVTLPMAALQKLPVFSITRTSGRFNFVVGLALAIMAGYGLAYGWQKLRHPRWQYTALAVAAAFIIWDYQSFWGMPTSWGEIPAGVTDLEERDDIRAIYDVPWDDSIFAKHAMYFQTAHHKPIITGQIVRATPVSPARLNLLQDTLDPMLLDWAEVDVVIVHYGGFESLSIAERARQMLGEPIYEDALIAIFDVPTPTRRLRFVRAIAPESESNRRADSYFFAPQAGWVEFSGTLSAPNREIILSLENIPMYSFQVDGTQTFRVMLPASEAGFYTARLELDPPCPTFADLPVQCQSMSLNNLTLRHFVADETWQKVKFERGLTLAGSYLEATAQPGERLPLALWWQFDQPLSETDVRFVHIFNAQGEFVSALQRDEALPIDYEAFDEWVDTPEIVIPPDLSPGTYEVYTGWYTYPAIARFGITSEGVDMRDNAVHVGSITIVAGQALPIGE